MRARPRVLLGGCLVGATLGACGPKPRAPGPGAIPTPAPPSPAAEASAEAPGGLTPAREALVAALRTRDAAPACAALEALTPAPTADLLWVVDTVTMPPAVGVRAATCVLRGHAGAASDALRRWVTHPDLVGLGWTLLAEIDAVAAQDEALAVELATLALTGSPDPAGARRRLQSAQTPAIVALLADGGPVPR